MAKKLPATPKRLAAVITNLISSGAMKNKTELAKLLHTQLNVVNDFLSGERPFTVLYAERLESAFPFVNGDYILSGRGSWQRRGVSSKVKVNSVPAPTESVELLRLRVSSLERELEDKKEIIELLRQIKR